MICAYILHSALAGGRIIRVRERQLIVNLKMGCGLKMCWNGSCDATRRTYCKQIGTYDDLPALQYTVQVRSCSRVPNPGFVKDSA